jgi:hypothetical protein
VYQEKNAWREWKYRLEDLVSVRIFQGRSRSIPCVLFTVIEKSIVQRRRRIAAAGGQAWRFVCGFTAASSDWDNIG